VGCGSVVLDPYDSQRESGSAALSETSSQCSHTFQSDDEAAQQIGASELQAAGSRCFEQAAFRLLLACSYRFSRVEVAEGSAAQAPGGKVAKWRGRSNVYINVFLLK
jgi:hypothetical protein